MLPTRMFVPTAAGLVMVAVTSTARAGSVDAAFVRDAAAITKAVRGLKAETVAVLKFGVKVGDGPARFDAGLANDKLAQMLENLLVLTNDPADPLFILTGAAAIATALPPGISWRDEGGRKAIAGADKRLPLAWDTTQKLTPSVFLAGDILVDPTLRSAELVVYAFTQADPANLRTLYTSAGATTGGARASVAADRSLLSLVGMSFAVDRSVGVLSSERDRDAIRRAAAVLGQPAEFADTVARCPVRLEIILNDRQVVPEADPASPGGGRIGRATDSDPKKGDAIRFRLVNTSTEKTYGVLLAVNGRNTNGLSKGADLHARDPKDQRLWVLGPNEEATIPGFYTDLKGNYQEFKILGDEASEGAYPLLGSQYRGLITLHVFGEWVEPPIPPKTSSVTEAGQASGTTSEPAAPTEVELSLLSLGVGGDALADVRAAGSPDKARAQVESLTNVSAGEGGRLRVESLKGGARDRGLIVASETRRSNGPLESVAFKRDPGAVAFLQIRYYGR
jgi:hypothetical protein